MYCRQTRHKAISAALLAAYIVAMLFSPMVVMAQQQQSSHQASQPQPHPVPAQPPPAQPYYANPVSVELALRNTTNTPVIASGLLSVVGQAVAAVSGRAFEILLGIVRDLVLQIIKPLAKYLFDFVIVLLHNPNIASTDNTFRGYQPLAGTYAPTHRAAAFDLVSPTVKQGIIYGFRIMRSIAVCLLLLLFIAAVWHNWINAAARGGANLLAPVGRLIATTALILSWPVISVSLVQISNEMIDFVYKNIDPVGLALAANNIIEAAATGTSYAVMGGLSAALLANVGLPTSLSQAANALQWVGCFLCFITLGVLIYECVAFLVLKAIQTAVMMAQYMFAPIFLAFYALPETEHIATAYVRSCIEVSLWTFIWAGLLRLLVVVMADQTVDGLPWGKLLMILGVLQIMLNVPQFMGKAQISPVSDFLSPKTFAGAATSLFTGVGAGLGAVVKNALTHDSRKSSSTNATDNTQAQALNYNALGRAKGSSAGQDPVGVPPGVKSRDGTEGRRGNGDSPNPPGLTTSPPAKKDTDALQQSVNRLCSKGHTSQDGLLSEEQSNALLAVAKGNPTAQQIATARSAVNDLIDKWGLHPAFVKLDQAVTRAETAEQAAKMKRLLNNPVAGASNVGEQLGTVTRLLSGGKINPEQAAALRQALLGKENATGSDTEGDVLGSLSSTDKIALAVGITAARKRNELAKTNNGLVDKLVSSQVISTQEAHVIRQSLDDANERFQLASELSGLAADGKISSQDADLLSQALAGNLSGQDLSKAQSLADNLEPAGGSTESSHVPGLRQAIAASEARTKFAHASSLLDKAAGRTAQAGQDVSPGEKLQIEANVAAGTAACAVAQYEEYRQRTIAELGAQINNGRSDSNERQHLQEMQESLSHAGIACCLNDADHAGQLAQLSAPSQQILWRALGTAKAVLAPVDQSQLPGTAINELKASLLELQSALGELYAAKSSCDAVAAESVAELNGNVPPARRF